MRALRPPTRDDSVTFLPTLLANLLPLVGVLWLEWEPATLVLVYGIEVALSLLVAGGKALFAQRPPPSAEDRDGVVSASEAMLTEKRGRVRIHDALPPIYQRNIPFFGVLLFVAVIAVAAWTGSVLVFWLGLAAVAVAVLVAIAIQSAKHYLEHGTLEYQRRGDYLVAYDRLLEEPQWAESVYRLRNVSLAGDQFVDRLLGTRTIRVTTGVRSTETERRLGPVADPDRLVEVFELPVATTDLEPVNRPLAAVAVLLTVGIVCSGPLLIVAPGVPAGVGLEAVYLAAFLLLVPWKLWQWACPDGE